MFVVSESFFYVKPPQSQRNIMSVCKRPDKFDRGKIKEIFLKVKVERITK